MCRWILQSVTTRRDTKRCVANPRPRANEAFRDRKQGVRQASRAGRSSCQETTLRSGNPEILFRDCALSEELARAHCGGFGGAGRRSDGREAARKARSRPGVAALSRIFAFDGTECAGAAGRGREETGASASGFLDCGADGLLGECRAERTERGSV